jgi:hypothetical protein
VIDELMVRGASLRRNRRRHAFGAGLGPARVGARRGAAPERWFYLVMLVVAEAVLFCDNSRRRTSLHAAEKASRS